MIWRVLGVCRFVGAALPLVIACYATITYAQDADRAERAIERRLAAVEITSARHDERYIALLAQVVELNKTVWWLIAATFGSTTVSGAVAADRAVYKWKQNKGDTR